ncbi:putative acyl- n-acyltransferase protein [Rosellinia necatrix]|uniref:Putative acyl-n-acyltransferase protein n=1 Tax=Rosellinia necatrix TaxID=77044 RepID=A0A1W2TL09_ROSNE|nr:putative acyl- n-acyltransferase protein [Rosellinia necatrix]
MGTPFITHIEPTRLDGYNARLPHDQQAARVPAAFRDAMGVREAVFVREQGCPLECEHDVDDARSCHWVMYASVKVTAEPEQRDPATDAVVRPRRSETATIPIATLRVVPFPHPPHPPDGARYVGGVLQPVGGGVANGGGSDQQRQQLGSDGASNGHVDENHPPGANSCSGGGFSGATTSMIRHRALSQVDEERLSAAMPFGTDRRTDFHDGKEPYVKLGRLAVLPEFRGHQVAVGLWNVAKKWLQENPTYFNPSVKELGMEVMKAGSVDDIPKWNGLVCVHAQEAVVKVYERWGFKVDKGMGKFYEEGIPHVGMFQRLEVKGTDPKI